MMTPVPETVFTMSDYWDGPRAGVASFLGRPHVFQCFFDGAAGEWSEIYVLKPITDVELELVLEDWTIWVSWYRAWRSGQAAMSSHPCLPQDRPRKAELDRLLAPILEVQPELAIRAMGHFSGTRPDEGTMEVTWQPVVST